MYELFNSTTLNKKGSATVVWIISAQEYAHKKLIFINNSYVYSVPHMLLVLCGMFDIIVQSLQNIVDKR